MVEGPFQGSPGAPDPQRTVAREIGRGFGRHPSSLLALPSLIRTTLPRTPPGLAFVDSDDTPEDSSSSQASEEEREREEGRTNGRPLVVDGRPLANSERPAGVYPNSSPVYYSVAEGPGAAALRYPPVEVTGAPPVDRVSRADEPSAVTRMYPGAEAHDPPNPKQNDPAAPDGHHVVPVLSPAFVEGKAVVAQTSKPLTQSSVLAEATGAGEHDPPPKEQHDPPRLEDGPPAPDGRGGRGPDLMELFQKKIPPPTNSYGGLHIGGGNVPATADSAAPTTSYGGGLAQGAPVPALFLPPGMITEDYGSAVRGAYCAQYNSPCAPPQGPAVVPWEGNASHRGRGAAAAPWEGKMGGSYARPYDPTQFGGVLYHSAQHLAGVQYGEQYNGAPWFGQEHYAVPGLQQHAVSQQARRFEEYSTRVTQINTRVAVGEHTVGEGAVPPHCAEEGAVAVQHQQHVAQQAAVPQHPVQQQDEHAVPQQHPPVHHYYQNHGFPVSPHAAPPGVSPALLLNLAPHAAPPESPAHAAAPQAGVLLSPHPAASCVPEAPQQDHVPVPQQHLPAPQQNDLENGNRVVEKGKASPYPPEEDAHHVVEKGKTSPRNKSDEKHDEAGSGGIWLSPLAGSKGLAGSNGAPRRSPAGSVGTVGVLLGNSMSTSREQ